MTIEILIFIGIAILFFLGIAIKEKLPKICPICIAISTSWITLLFFRELNIFKNDALLAILIGESIIGFYYLIDSKIVKKIQLFRLPFLLTLTFIGYSLIIKQLNYKIAVFLLFLWILFFTLKGFKNPRAQNFIKKIISCCKNW